MTRDAQARTATVGDAGRTCPYCQFPLKPGAALAACATCDAAHHDDCWAENGGCAVVGCQNAPHAASSGATTEPVGAGAPGAWSAATTAAPSPTAAPSSGAPLQPPRRSVGGIVAAAIVVLALAIAGSAAAFVLTRDDDGEQVVAEAITTVTEAAATSSDDQASDTDASGATGVDQGDTSTEPSDDGGVLPDVPEAEMAEEIATVIGDYHRAIGSGDTDTAWDLLSSRRHRLETSQTYRDGRFRDRQSWEHNELETGQKVDPGSPTVEILELDRRHGVATVDVRGMRAIGAAGRRCGGRWEGTTWAKYEDGGWTYEPGANTTPSRKQRYPNAGQRSDLLGNTCQ